LPENKSPFLPGGASPITFFLKKIPHEGKSILLLGNGFSQLIPFVMHEGFSSIQSASDDNTEVFEYKANTSKNQQFPALVVDYESLDHNTGEFDFVFCQTTLTKPIKTKLIKEIKRILKPDGILITSEIICVKKPAPIFLNDIWIKSGQDPHYGEEFEAFYTTRGFNLIESAEFPNDLDEFYIKSYKILETNLKSMSAEKRVQFRKDFVQEKHEITSMVKGGALKFLNFKTLILQKI
jgi:SAM-dependent methyltransferase